MAGEKPGEGKAGGPFSLRIGGLEINVARGGSQGGKFSTASGGGKGEEGSGMVAFDQGGQTVGTEERFISRGDKLVPWSEATEEERKEFFSRSFKR